MADLITNASAFLEPIEYSSRSTDEKAAINALISSASEYIERYCNRIFIASAYTDEIHDGKGWDSVFVDNIPLNSLTDVDVIYSSAFSSITTITFKNDKFDINTNTGEIRFKPDTFLTDGGHIFPDGFRNVQITYNGGFSAIPKPIEMITADYVIQMFDPAESVETVEKEKIGDYFYAKSKNYFDNLPFTKKKILNSYKLRRIFQ